MDKKLCDCLAIATYWYMPGYMDKSNPYHCEDCVPRGCECREIHSDVNSYYPPLDNPILPTQKDYPIEWIEEGKIYYL